MILIFQCCRNFLGSKVEPDGGLLVDRSVWNKTNG